LWSSQRRRGEEANTVGDRLEDEGDIRAKAKGVSIFQDLDFVQDQQEKIQKENEGLKEARLIFRDCLMGIDPELKETEKPQVTNRMLVSRIHLRFDPDRLIPR
jgi:hypothetical protein